MMRLTRFSLLIGLLFVVGCATTNHDKAKFNIPSFTEEELVGWKIYYDQLEVEQASDMEKWLIKKSWFKSRNQVYAESFDWLKNKKKLSDKDHLFLIRVNNEGKVLAPRKIC